MTRCQPVTRRLMRPIRLQSGLLVSIYRSTASNLAVAALWMLLGGLSAIYVCWNQAVAQPKFLPGAELDDEGEDPEAANDLHSLYYSAHLPTNRRLAQDLTQAKQLFSTGRYSEGLPLLDRVLAAEEDSFLLPHQRESTGVATSLKLAAKQLLTELPPTGVAALELDQGARARRELASAAEKGALAELANVARRYPVTEAATDALASLAQAELDAGRFLDAAAIYEELLTWPKANAQHGRLLAVRLTWCYAAAQSHKQFQRAADQLRQLSAPTQRAEIAKLTGTDDLDTWLEEIRPSSTKTAVRLNNDSWLTEGRNYSRNPTLPSGSAPHAWPAWAARTVKQFHIAKRIDSRRDAQNRRGKSWGLVASPIAVGNYIVVRTPTNIIALDWQTGRRVWETRPEPAPKQNHALHLQFSAGNEHSQVVLDAIEQRLWADSVYGALSSDGDRVYAIRNLESLNLRANARLKAGFFGRMDEELTEPGNTLTAYELKTEGKRLWEVNGDTNPQLAGCFFLGAPIFVGDSLYVMAEFANAVHLLELDASDGALLWQQPLANMERSVTYDVGRRLAGAAPSQAGGLIYCPTGAGSVVAIDPIDRSLAWAFRFEVDESIANRAEGRYQQQLAAYQPNMGSRWERNRVVVAGDALLVTAPECKEFYCLDARTGAKRWSVERDDHRYLAGVAGHRVVLVGDRHVSLFDLETGKPVNQAGRIKMPDDKVVVGLGLLAGDSMIVPLSGNQFGVVNLESGQLDRVVAVREGHAVGNLAFHRGSLLSQSGASLSRFDEISTLEERLADSATSTGTETEADGLRIRGEIAWSEGRLSEAIDYFVQAHQQFTSDPLLRRRLSDALVSGLRSDYGKYQSYTDLLAELATDTKSQLQLYRFIVDGSLSAGEPKIAYEYARKIFDIDQESLVDGGDGHHLQAERWFVGRLNRIWNSADQSLRETITAQVERLSARALESIDPNQLARLVRYYGASIPGRDAQQALATQWVADNRASEAELLLLQSEEIGSPALAAIMPKPTTAAYGVKTPREWPYGRVEVTQESIRGEPAQPAFIDPRSRSRTSTMRSQLAVRSNGVGWTGPSQLAVAYGVPGELIAWNELGEVIAGVPLKLTALQSTNSNGPLTCIRFGSFAVLGAGAQVASVDLSPGGSRQGPLLWTSAPNNNNNYNVDARFRAIQLAVAGQKAAGVQVFGPVTAGNTPTNNGNLAGELCAASPWGVVLRQGDIVRCVDAVSGDLLWQRRDMPTSGATYGDRDHLYLIADGEATGQIFSMVDGATVGEWNLPEGKTISSCGSHLAVSRFQAGRRVIRVVDIKSGKQLFEQKYSREAKDAMADPTTLAVMEPTGEFEVIDLETGTQKFKQVLQSERGLVSIHLLPSGDSLIVATNTRTAPQHSSSGNVALENSPVVTGSVYALDPMSGDQLWDYPATVNGQGLWQLQPTGSPALVFLSRYMNRKESKQGGVTRLLCLDKRTGRSLMRENELASADNRPWSMGVEQTEEPRVTLDLRHTAVSLKFTDTPRPPEPVAIAEVEGRELKSSSSGIFGILKKSFGGSIGRSQPGPPIDDDD